MGPHSKTRPRAVAAVLAVLSTTAGSARAEPAATSAVAERRTLTPPRAIDAGVVPYPARATGAATVVVELVVDAEGQVSDARVVLGDAPFTQATMEAAWRWRFEPARRDDRPIPARVRVRVDFTPPVHIPAPPPPAEVAAPDVTEVTVKGRRPDPGQTTLGGGEVRQIPGAFGDAFRAIDALPGVVPMASGLPYYFIRGAPPGDTGYFLDGVRVPLLFHAAVGPSVIHPGLIDRIDFFPGGAPAEYGRFAGGVISAFTPDPATAAHAEGLVRVFDAGALAETPFADGRGSALVAGRYSYAGAILSLTSPIQLAYWDYQARATWKLGERDEIRIFAFGSYDDFGQVVSGVTDTILDGGFHRVDVRYEHEAAHGTLRVATTLGYARSNNDHNNIRDLTGSVRATYEDRVSPSLTVRAGSDVTLDRYDLLGNTLPDPYIAAETNVLYPPHVDVAIGGYADVVWQLSPRVQVVPGLRVDLFASHRYDDLSAELASVGAPLRAVTSSARPAVDPRLSARVEVAPHVSLVSTVGVTHQPAAYVVPIPGLTVVEPDPVLQTAFQLSQGVAVALPADIVLQATGFLHTYENLTDLTSTCSSVFGAGVLLGNAPGIMNNLCVVETVRGQAFGGELSVRRSLTKRLTGWVSYTLSRSTREAPSPEGFGATVTIPSAFDRTHVVSALAAYDLGASWRAGARIVAYTGLPYTNTRDYVPVAPYNGARMPAFYRVDVRLEKRWRVRERVTLSLVFEGMNVTLTKEVLGMHCAPAAGQAAGSLDACTPQTLGPITVPSVGIEGAF